MRAVGWVNCLISAVWAVMAADGVAVLALAGTWAASVLALTYAIGWFIDKRAERIVTR